MVARVGVLLGPIGTVCRELRCRLEVLEVFDTDLKNVIICPVGSKFQGIDSKLACYANVMVPSSKESLDHIGADRRDHLQDRLPGT